MCVHGDGFDAVTTNFRWLALLGSFSYSMLLMINRAYNWTRKLRGKEYFSISRAIKAKVKGAVNAVGRYEDALKNFAMERDCIGIICGHIHTPADKMIDGIHYLNSGDWVESMTAIGETYDGRFELIEFETFQQRIATMNGTPSTTMMDPGDDEEPDFMDDEEPLFAGVPPGWVQGGRVDYLAFSLLMLLAQFSPGPDMLLLIRNSLAHPLRAGLWTVAGIAAGLSVHLTAVLTGLALAVKESRVLFPALLLTGGAWLSWMALQLIRTRPEPPDASTGDQRLPLSDRAAFLQGLLTNLTNAKAVLAWLGTAPTASRKAAAAAIILCQALLFWGLFVLALQHPVVRRGWHRTARPLHLLFGIGLLALGLNAIRDGIQLLRGEAPPGQSVSYHSSSR